jgi:hypothetical protein
VRIPAVDAYVEPTLWRINGDGTFSNDLEAENKANASKITVRNTNGEQAVKNFGSVAKLQQSVALPATYDNSSVRLVTLGELIQKGYIYRTRCTGHCSTASHGRGAGCEWRTYYVPSDQAEWLTVRFRMGLVGV